MILRDARPDEIDRVLGHTHALWSDGLGPEDYRAYVRALMDTPWARGGGRRFRFLVMVADEDGPEILSAMKLYRFAARAGGRPISVGGVGAVFTPPDGRGRGHAAAMIHRAHAIMAARGDALSLLYSEIGGDYYAALGYRAAASRPVRVAVPPAGPRPAGVWVASGGVPGAVARIRQEEDAAATFALLRDRPYWEHLWARAAIPTAMLGPERWESRLVTTRGSGGAGYLWALFGASHEGAAAKLLEIGEDRPGAVTGALLDDLFAECRRRGVRALDAWITPDTERRDPRLSGAGVTPISPHPALPMIRGLGADGASEPASVGDAPALHLTDVF